MNDIKELGSEVLRDLYFDNIYKDYEEMFKRLEKLILYIVSEMCNIAPGNENFEDLTEDFLIDLKVGIREKLNEK